MSQPTAPPHMWLLDHRNTLLHQLLNLQAKLDLLDELIAEAQSLDPNSTPAPLEQARGPGRPRKLHERSPGLTRHKPPPQHNPYNMEPEDMVATRERVPLTAKHDRAFAALEVAGPAGLTAEQLAADTGMKRGTASSLLSSLKAHGFATHKTPHYFIISGGSSSWPTTPPQSDAPSATTSPPNSNAPSQDARGSSSVHSTATSVTKATPSSVAPSSHASPSHPSL